MANQINAKCSECKGKGYLPCKSGESRIVSELEYWGGMDTWLAVNCSGSGRCTLRFVRNMDLSIFYLYKPRNIHVHPDNICPNCHGKKIINKNTCSLCNGSGICPVCKGNGKCIFCSGDGMFKCKTCNGTGSVVSRG